MIKIAFSFVSTVFSKMTWFRMIKLTRCIAAFRIKFAFYSWIDSCSNGFIVHNGNHMWCWKINFFMWMTEWFSLLCIPDNDWENNSEKLIYCNSLWIVSETLKDLLLSRSCNLALLISCTKKWSKSVSRGL